MPKEVNFYKVVSAIIHMSSMIGQTLRSQLHEAIMCCTSEAVVDETAQSRLWGLYLEIPEFLRESFPI